MGLAHFQFVTNSQLGSSNEILMRRTVLGSYAPLLTAQRRVQVMSLLASGQPGKTKAVMGLIAASFSCKHPLRFCRACCEEDLERYGRTSWRVEHQLPAVIVCLHHGERLTDLVGQGAEWVLPPRPTKCVLQSSNPILEVERRLTAVAVALRGARNVDRNTVASTAISAIVRAAAAAGTPQRLNAAQVEDWFKTTQVYKWACQAEGVREQLARPNLVLETLRGRRSAHPIRLCLVWAAAHESFDEGEMLGRLRLSASGTTPEQPQLELWDELPATRWRRAPHHFVRLVEEGKSDAEICACLNISRSTARRWMQDDPSLLEQVREQRQAQRIDQVRQELVDHISHNAACTRSSLLRDKKAASEWLRLHAPDQLRAVLDLIMWRPSRQLSFFHSPSVVLPSSHEDRQ